MPGLADCLAFPSTEAMPGRQKAAVAAAAKVKRKVLACRLACRLALGYAWLARTLTLQRGPNAMPGVVDYLARQSTEVLLRPEEAAKVWQVHRQAHGCAQVARMLTSRLELNAMDKRGLADFRNRDNDADIQGSYADVDGCSWCS